MNYTLVKLAFHSVHVDMRKGESAYERKKVFDIVLKFFRSVISGKLYLPNFTTEEHLFFVTTDNQYAALKNIHSQLRNRSLTYYHGHDVSIKHDGSSKYPFWIAYLVSLLAYVRYYFVINKLANKFKKTNRSLGYHYLIALSFGHYFFNNILLKINKPQYLWMSNDHTYPNVAFLYSAKNTGVKSIYLQHASVSPLFPPLAFDYAFLDGEIAYATYKNIGIMGTSVYLSGISKMDGYIGKYPYRTVLSKILICINHLDDAVVFEELIDELARKGYSVTVRKHPYMIRVLRNENEVKISKENIFADSLNDIDFLIAGDSNVHLEATLSNIPCFYLSTSKYFDYYGFLKHGLVIWGGDNLTECIEQVQNYVPQEDVYLRAKPYCASVGTKFENKSTSFILKQLGINDN